MTRYSDDGFTTADGEGPDRVRVRCGACGKAFPSLDAEEAHVCTRGRELHRDLDDDDGGRELVADGGLPPVEERPVSESEAARRAAQERIVARARDVRTDGGVKQGSGPERCAACDGPINERHTAIVEDDGERRPRGVCRPCKVVG